MKILVNKKFLLPAFIAFIALVIGLPIRRRQMFSKNETKENSVPRN